MLTEYNKQTSTELINATIKNDIDTIKKLLDEKISPDVLNNQYSYSLPGDVWASEYKYAQNTLINGNFTLFYFACFYNYTEIIKLYANNKDIDINKASTINEIVKYSNSEYSNLLSRTTFGANSGTYNNIDFNITPLTFSIFLGIYAKDETLFNLLTSLPSIDANATLFGTTPLVLTITGNYLREDNLMYKNLLNNKNIDINKPCDDENILNKKYTPLMAACTFNRIKIINDLLSRSDIDIYKEIESPDNNDTYSAISFARNNYVKQLLLNPPNHPPQPWTMWGIDKTLWTDNAKPYIKSPDSPPLMPDPPLNFPTDVNSIEDMIDYFNKVGQPGNIFASSNSFPDTQHHTQYGDKVTVNNLKSYSDALDVLESNWNSIINGKYIQTSFDAINNNLTLLQTKYDKTIPNTHNANMSELNTKKSSANSKLEDVNSNITSTVSKSNDARIKLETKQHAGEKLNQALYKVSADEAYFKDLNIQQLKVLDKDILIQTSTINNKINDIEYNKYTKEREGGFLFDKKGVYNYVNTVLFYLYYVVLVVFIYFYFTVTKSDYRVKIIIIILLGLYPFIINFLEKYIFYVCELIYSMMLSKVYKSPKMQYDTSMEKN